MENKHKVAVHIISADTEDTFIFELKKGERVVLTPFVDEDECLTALMVEKDEQTNISKGKTEQGNGRTDLS